MKDKLGFFNRMVTNHLIAAMTGFGVYWWYQLFKWNVWVALFFALLTSSYMSVILNKK